MTEHMDSDAKTRAELDQMLSEALDDAEGWEEELYDLAGGDGPILDPELANLARMASGAITVVIGLRDLLEDELMEGYENA